MTNIVGNFAVGTNGYLFSLRYADIQYDNENEHELIRLIKLWQDPEFLVEFFENHKDDIRSGHFGKLTFEAFIERTGREAKRMIRVMLAASKAEDNSILNQLFQPLDDRDHDRQNYEQLKSKGKHPGSWLRLYALQTMDDKIYIVGGALKFVEKMNEREHLRRELERLVSVRKELSAYIREGTLGELQF